MAGNVRQVPPLQFCLLPLRLARRRTASSADPSDLDASGLSSDRCQRNERRGGGSAKRVESDVRKVGRFTRRNPLRALRGRGDHCGPCLRTAAGAGSEPPPRAWPALRTRLARSRYRDLPPPRLGVRRSRRGPPPAAQSPCKRTCPGAAGYGASRALRLLAGSADHARRTSQQGSASVASLLHDSRQLNGGGLEPDLIQPRFNLTTLRPAKNGKQWPQGVSTEITVQLHTCVNWLLVGLAGK